MTDAAAGVVVSFETLVALAADAARQGDVETLGRVLTAGVPVGATTPRGDSLLMLAAYYDRVPAVRLLLERGADPNQRDAKGQTPLAGVAFKGLIETAGLLAAAGADLNAEGADGKTPLIMAAAFNRVAMVEWLLNHGASASHRDASGATALDVARALGALDAAAVLETRSSQPAVHRPASLPLP